MCCASGDPRSSCGLNISGTDVFVDYTLVYGEVLLKVPARALGVWFCRDLLDRDLSRRKTPPVVAIARAAIFGKTRPIAAKRSSG